MEDELDAISRGEDKKIDYLNNFFFGQNGTIGLKTKLDQEFDKNNARLISSMENQNKSLLREYSIFSGC